MILSERISWNCSQTFMWTISSEVWTEVSESTSSEAPTHDWSNCLSSCLWAGNLSFPACGSLRSDAWVSWWPGSWFLSEGAIWRTECGRMTEVEAGIYNLISKVTYYHFCHILLRTQTNPCKMLEETTQRWKFQETQVTGGHLMADYYTDRIK